MATVSLMKFIDSKRLEEVLSISAAIDALEAAFGRAELPAAPQRSHLDVGNGELLLMPSWDQTGTGVKLVSVAPGNPDRGLPLIQGVYVFFDADTLTPKLVIDGAALTGLRTAAVSGLATRYLARPDSKKLVLFGSGAQARWHLRAMQDVLDLSEVVVVSRTVESAEAFASKIDGLSASVAGPEAVADADVICTCTTSGAPVFDGRLLSPGTHVNAVGAYKPDRREVDGTVVAASKLVVESRAPALVEAGDIVMAIAEGLIDESHIVADLQELVAGAPVRSSAPDITLFKSVGSAFEDLVVATALGEVYGT